MTRTVNYPTLVHWNVFFCVYFHIKILPRGVLLYLIACASCPRTLADTATLVKSRAGKLGIYGVFRANCGVLDNLCVIDMCISLHQPLS
jgi:hypothetical protein